MSGYRHHDHAGNHGDVLKHLVLVSLLESLTRHPEPLLYLESHAGAGGYSLLPGGASASGIDRLWQCRDAPAPVSRYLELVREFNAGDELTTYPGSPWLAGRLLRADDRLQLFERDPEVCAELGRCFAADRRVRVDCMDGYAGCQAALTPATGNVLMLLDPPYADPVEYGLAVESVRSACKAFPVGVFALWYPLLQDSPGLPQPIYRLAELADATCCELVVAPKRPGTGMSGSGVLVINAPPDFAGRMETALPWLARALGEGEGRWRLDRLP